MCALFLFRESQCGGELGQLVIDVGESELRQAKSLLVMSTDFVISFSTLENGLRKG